MKRKTLITLSALGGAALLLAGSAALFFFTQRISYDDTITADVHAPVRIIRNDKGVPLIQAQSKDDICYALGYLHAQDRFIAMEYFRAIANSTISRLIGERGILLEKIIKTAGIRSQARTIEENLASPYKEYLAAYVKGVNHIKHEWGHAFQNVLIEEDWTTSDIISVLLLREWAHAFLNNRELIFQIPEEKQNTFLREIFPPDMLYFYDRETSLSVEMIGVIRDLIKEFVGPFNEGFSVALASNDAMSRNGLYACSMKSVMNNYPGWYPVHVQYGEILIRGITQAGLPFLLCGDNQNIQFSGFNLTVDTQDFILEEVKNINGIINYRSRMGWKEFKSVREPLNLGKNNDSRHDIVWYTDNGPVLNDIFDTKTHGDTVITIKAIFPGPDYIVSLFEIPFSESIEKARKNIIGITSLPRVYLFSDGTGIIKCYSGRVPMRTPSNAVLRSSFYDAWYGTADLSVYMNTEKGYATAGSSFVSGAPPIIRTAAIEDSLREKYLLSLLEDRREPLNENELKKILLDNYNPAAAIFTPLFLEMLQTNPVTSARLTRIFFKDWDYRMSGKSVAPGLFYGILNNYILETLKDEFGYMKDRLLEYSPLLIVSFANAVRQKQSYYFDDLATDPIETSEEIFDRAFLKTMRDINRKRGPIMNDWTWETIHKSHYRLPFKKTFTAKMYYDLNEQSYEGGSMTVYSNSTGSELLPQSNTALLAIFSSEKPVIAMDFGYSINPMSDFYYGKHQGQAFIGYRNVEEIYLTTINPLSR